MLSRRKFYRNSTRKLTTERSSKSHHRLCRQRRRPPWVGLLKQMFVLSRDKQNKVKNVRLMGNSPDCTHNVRWKMNCDSISDYQSVHPNLKSERKTRSSS